MCISYIGVKNTNTSDRVTKLALLYYFDCKCVRCAGTEQQKEAVEAVVRSMQCPSDHCPGALVHYEGEPRKCALCGFKEVKRAKPSTEVLAAKMHALTIRQ